MQPNRDLPILGVDYKNDRRVDRALWVYGHAFQYIKNINRIGLRLSLMIGDQYNMNETDLKILGKQKIIEKNKKVSKEMKVLSAVCLFFSFCYCNGAKNLESADKGQIVFTNLVWIISFVVLIVLFIKDSDCIKNNKALEFDIYRLEVEDINDKKELAEITEEVLSDYLLNKQIDMPDEKISLPILYYCILAGIDIIIRISLINVL